MVVRPLKELAAIMVAEMEEILYMEDKKVVVAVVLLTFA